MLRATLLPAAVCLALFGVLAESCQKGVSGPCICITTPRNGYRVECQNVKDASHITEAIDAFLIPGAIEVFSIKDSPELTKLPAGLFGGCSAISHLSFSNVALEEVKSDLFLPRNKLIVESLSIHGSALTSINGSFVNGAKNLRFFSLRKNKRLTHLVGQLEAKNLEYVSFGLNSINHVDEDFFAKAESLLIADLTQNQITEHSFGQSQDFPVSALELNLNRNNLEALPIFKGHLPKMVFTEGNGFTYLEEENLKTFVQKLRESHPKPKPHEIFVSLEYNPLVCTCRMKYLLDIQDRVNGRCYDKDEEIGKLTAAHFKGCKW